MATSFVLVFLGVMLTCFNNAQALPKNAVNPKGRRNQKNSCRKEQIALPNLKRSGFVFIDAKFKALISIEHKTKCRCFFDACRIVQKAHCWIDKALWVLWRSKMRQHS
jgi:hypothetical protein